ncbi:MAG TPA: ubiquinone/menaquinone biosynthesis methyltransferase [Gemmatimonadales bacterium]|jgi:demethylmenaquinone methyltransferase/2-methoxy-6-polyprenyl-1,4-benzoquinol methylase|nr:ubiquinone/menaquinone biosynthesis methyltransferase [Gemmatimonadales bacterium]
MQATDQALPVTGGDAKRKYVRDAFAGIAPRYDRLNHLLSLNADRRWRRRAVNRLPWQRTPNGRYLDLCAGTLDLAAELSRRDGFGGAVVAVDFVPAMLRLGRGKAARMLPAGADALRLPFAAHVFDGATVGFGVRNLMDLDAGLRETARVLKAGATLVVLEFTTPRWQPFRALYLAYFRRILPRIGRLVSKHTSAYDWLPASVLAFPDPAALALRLEAAGFTQVTWDTLWGGIVAVHVATRKAA